MSVSSSVPESADDGDEVGLECKHAMPLFIWINTVGSPSCSGSAEVAYIGSFEP